jgi:GMP synthase-like glutamine amidotransferase
MILIIKHISIEGPGIIDDFFQNTRWQLQTVEFEKGNKLPDDFRDIEAVITLGGPMNVYEEDRFPFLKAEDIFLKKAIEEEIPILGICLGAQLLAKACGAEVSKAAQEEIGWYKVNVTEDGRKDTLFKELDRKLDVFQWHNDTFQLPRKAELLATSELCRNQAFRLGKNAYGLQFHIEVTPDMVESWIREYLPRTFKIQEDTTRQRGRGLHSNDPDKIIDSKDLLIDTYKKEQLFRRQASIILYNFSQIIANN